MQTQNPQLEELIKNSINLSDEQKAVYITMSRYLDPAKMSRLKEILETEKNEVARIEAEHNSKMSEINAKHIKEIQKFKAQSVEKYEKEQNERQTSDQLK